MSSAGTISRSKINPITRMGEGQRRQESAIASLPGPQEQTKRVTGVITKIHTELPRFVKAVNIFDGSPIGNDSWIELNHSAAEIAERWGTVRVGFRIKVVSIGPSGEGADATIINVDSEDTAEPHIPNEVGRSLWQIFCPGIGG